MPDDTVLTPSLALTFLRLLQNGDWGWQSGRLSRVFVDWGRRRRDRWGRKEIDNTQLDLSSTFHLPAEKVPCPLSTHAVLLPTPLAALRGSEAPKDSARVTR